MGIKKVLGQASETLADSSRRVSRILQKYLISSDSMATGTFFLHAEINMDSIINDLKDYGKGFKS